MSAKAVAVPGVVPAAGGAVPEVVAKDAIIAWFRGEFAAANAIIDALCGHVAHISGDGGAEYDAVFAAIHRRRMNWIPVVQMQRYYSIADVAAELRRVAASRIAAAEMEEAEMRRLALEEEVKKPPPAEEWEEERAAVGSVGAPATEEEGAEGDSARDCAGDSTDQKLAEEVGVEDGGSQEAEACTENVQICSDHEECMARPDSITTLKGFVAKEPVKGHMVNVVKGLKVFTDIFSDSEILKVAEFINELRLAGRRGELSGETFIFFNKQIKGNKREIIQLGVPLFQPTKEEAASKIEAIPLVLQKVIDHLVQWRLIPESKKPNSCIINFFDEDEYSQPYFKPPHLDNPISTLVLSETTMAFGRVLVSDSNGNYKGSLTLPLKEGSLVVMRGNSADMARHVICPSSSRRVSITFVKVRPANTNQIDPSSVSPAAKAMTLWQPASPPLQKLPGGGGAIAYAHHGMVPTWGLALRSPLVMLAPSRPMAMSPSKRIGGGPGRGGTGVFLPWTVGPKKYTKHLPPRIQKRRLPSLSPPLEAH